MSREYPLHPDSVGDIVSIPQDRPYFEDEDDDEDGWGGGFISSGREDDTDGFSDRTSSIRRMLEEEDDDDEDEDAYGSDDEEGRGGGGGALPFYDRSPGEVYTIPEEEEDMTSPSVASSTATWDGELNPDTASSLLRWRGIEHVSNLPPFQDPPECIYRCLSGSSACVCASTCLSVLLSLCLYLSISICHYLSLQPVCCCATVQALTVTPIYSTCIIHSSS